MVVANMADAVVFNKLTTIHFPTTTVDRMFIVVCCFCIIIVAAVVNIYGIMNVVVDRRRQCNFIFFSIEEVECLFFGKLI